MKFYNSVGPNPRVVTMFMLEKGIALTQTEIDLRGGENRRRPYLDINPTGQMPALELDDGSVLSEIVPICEYLEELYPRPVMIGATPEARGRTRMWTRRVDLKICEPLAAGFRYAEGLALFDARIRCLPEAADGLKAIARDGVAWLDEQMDDRPFLCGDEFTLADIMLFAFLDFGNSVGQPLDPANEKIAAWFDRVKERGSAEKSA